METLSFVLGMSSVVVIAVAVVAVIGFFKARKIERRIEQVESDIYREIQSKIAETHRRIDDFEKDVYSQLDSRLDKLENNVFSQLDSRLDKLENKLTTTKK